MLCISSSAFIVPTQHDHVQPAGAGSDCRLWTGLSVHMEGRFRSRARWVRALLLLHYSPLLPLRQEELTTSRSILEVGLLCTTLLRSANWLARNMPLLPYVVRVHRVWFPC